jgi:hypothetical protein
MTGSALLLSRAQFAFTIGFHILWPAYTIGVSGFIVIVSILWLRTGQPVYRALMGFWIHLFALGFAMGVVTGLVMSYQIGTNWSVFAERTANVIGPFFTYESADGVLPRSRLCRCDAVWHEPGERSTSFPHALLLRSVRSSAHSGFWLPIAGCRHPPDSDARPTANLRRSAGWMRSLPRPCRTVTSTWSRRPISLGRLSSSVYAASICGGGAIKNLPAPDFPLLCGSYWFSCRFTASWATCTGETLSNINQSRLRPWRAIGRRALANVSFYSPGPTLPTSATTTSSRFRGSEV